MNIEREEALAGLETQPDWLAALRTEAWDAFESLPLPTRKLEEWRYTDVEQLKLDDVTRAAAFEGSPPAEARALLEDREAAAKVLVVGSSVMELEVDPAVADQGVIIMELAQAAAEHPELVRRHLGTAVAMDHDKLAALNGALWTGGLFVHVPDGVVVEKPIRVARWLPESGRAVFPRTLLVAGANSHVAYVDEFGSPDFDEPTLSLGAVEVIAGDGADVQYVAMQQWGHGVRHLSYQRTLAQRDANLDTLVVNLGASVARVDLNARLEGPGARSDMLGLYFARGGQHFDHNTRQDHVSGQAESDLLYKGTLYDRAKTVFRGVIRVFPGAQRTDAYQTNRNILLSEDAEAVSLPNLEIEADDVKCSHGATVGQLDEEELFYLMSRGLDRESAERLVIFGFFGEVLDRLPLPGVVAELKTAIEAKIR
ncbi:MAG: Fe-S cluster assembly protein SufD [Longimicrobiales bacterium]